MERHNLYLFRCDKKLTQEEMATILGVSRATYSFVERGVRSGSSDFWTKFQKAFDIPDTDMYRYMRKVERKKEV